MLIRKYTNKFTKEVSRLLKPLLVEKEPEPTTERCCIHLCAHELSLVHVNRTQDSTQVVSIENLFYEDLDSLTIVLSSFYKKNNLSAVPTFWLLSPENYQVFLMDALPVSQEEFSEALHWRIRSLINFPFEDATIDYFKIPPKRGTTENMIAAIVAKRSQITAIIDAFKKAAVALTTIDIPELAMRNLTCLYEDDEKSTAFIYLYERLAILNITRKKTLYFTRRINLFAENNDASIDYKQIGLDLLRYFDYFQSQWRLPSPVRIFVASEKWNADDIAKKLSEYLSLTVEAYRIKSILTSTKKTEALEQKNLLALGCALREDCYAASRS